MSEPNGVERWRGSVDAEVRHLIASQDRIEEMFVQHVAEEQRTLQRIETRIEDLRLWRAWVIGWAMGAAALVAFVTAKLADLWHSVR